MNQLITNDYGSSDNLRAVLKKDFEKESIIQRVFMQNVVLTFSSLLVVLNANEDFTVPVSHSAVKGQEGYNPRDPSLRNVLLIHFKAFLTCNIFSLQYNDPD